MIFNQRDATIGAGNLIPDPIGGPLTLTPFSAVDTQDVGVVLPLLGLVSRTTLTQGPADGFGSLNLVIFQVSSFLGQGYSQSHFLVHMLHWV